MFVAGLAACPLCWVLLMCVCQFHFHGRLCPLLVRPAPAGPKQGLGTNSKLLRQRPIHPRLSMAAGLGGQVRTGVAVVAWWQTRYRASSQPARPYCRCWRAEQCSVQGFEGSFQWHHHYNYVLLAVHDGASCPSINLDKDLATGLFIKGCYDYTFTFFYFFFFSFFFRSSEPFLFDNSSSLPAPRPLI